MKITVGVSVRHVHLTKEDYKALIDEYQQVLVEQFNRVDKNGKVIHTDIHAGNITYKTLVHTAKVKNGCILTGTQAPVILTSRSDTFETKVNSIALAAIVAENLKKNK